MQASESDNPVGVNVTISSGVRREEKLPKLLSPLHVLVCCSQVLFKKISKKLSYPKTGHQ